MLVYQRVNDGKKQLISNLRTKQLPKFPNVDWEVIGNISL